MIIHIINHVSFQPAIRRFKISQLKFYGEYSCGQVLLLSYGSHMFSWSRIHVTLKKTGITCLLRVHMSSTCSSCTPLQERALFVPRLQRTLK